MSLGQTAWFELSRRRIEGWTYRQGISETPRQFEEFVPRQTIKEIESRDIILVKRIYLKRT